MVTLISCFVIITGESFRQRSTNNMVIDLTTLQWSWCSGGSCQCFAVWVIHWIIHFLWLDFHSLYCCFNLPLKRLNCYPWQHYRRTLCNPPWQRKTFIFVTKSYKEHCGCVYCEFPAYKSHTERKNSLDFVYFTGCFILRFERELYTVPYALKSYANCPIHAKYCYYYYRIVVYIITVAYLWQSTRSVG